MLRVWNLNRNFWYKRTFCRKCTSKCSLHWRHNGHCDVSNHQPQSCLLSGLFRRRSAKISKLRVTGLCVRNSPGPVNSPHKGPVTRKMFPFDDVIMLTKGWPRSQCVKTQLVFLHKNYCVDNPNGFDVDHIEDICVSVILLNGGIICSLMIISNVFVSLWMNNMVHP